jgi:HPt (histidine-containing phosphotransfer) domain-containing protein
VPSDTSSPPTATPAAPPEERAPDTAPDELIDSAALRKVAGEDKSAQAQFIVRFRNTNNDDLDLLERALSQADFTTAGRTAHRIRGAAVLLGLGPLAEAAAELETATLDSRAEVCAQAQARLLRTVQALYRHFDACYHSRGEA